MTTLFEVKDVAAWWGAGVFSAVGLTGFRRLAADFLGLAGQEAAARPTLACCLSEKNIVAFSFFYVVYWSFALGSQSELFIPAAPPLEPSLVVKGSRRFMIIDRD